MEKISNHLRPDGGGCFQRGMSMKFIFKRRLNLFDVAVNGVAVYGITQGWIFSAIAFGFVCAVLSILMETKLGFDY